MKNTSKEKRSSRFRTPRIIGLLGLLTAAGTGTLVLAEGNTATPQPTLPSWRVPAGDPVRGKELAVTCMACHSKAAAGGGVNAPKLRGQRESYVFHSILAYRDGARKNEVMQPLVAELSDQDARDLAAYLAGPFPDRPPPKGNTTHQAYRITSATCTWCHGQTGLGEFEGMPVLTGQDPAYLTKALAQYRSGERREATMRGVTARHATAADDAALADYYAGYSWVDYE